MVKKSIIWWGAPRPQQPDEVIEFLGKFYHLMLSRSLEPDIQRIKAVNLNSKVLFYIDLIAVQSYQSDWSEINIHDDWFLKDINGNRIINRQYGWYLMDITNLGWMDYFASYARNLLEQYPLLDGIFADDAWAFWRNSWGVFTVPDEYLPELPNWHEDMIAFLRYIKSKIGNKLLIPNTQDPIDYAKASDGKFQEGWVHAPWRTSPYSKEVSLDHIDKLAYLSSMGKNYLAHSGYQMADVMTPEELETVHNVMYYCLCSYLLGVSGQKSSFGWMAYHWTLNKRDHSRGYYPEMDVEPGRPRGKYYEVNSDVYGRDFDHAKVFVNFSDTENYEFTVDQINYALTPRSGIIIPWDAPFISVREILGYILPFTVGTTIILRNKKG